MAGRDPFPPSPAGLPLGAGEPVIERPTLAQIEDGLAEIDYYVCAIRLFNETVRRRDQQAKNQARTARA